MCGIVGYIGNREAAPILLEGLEKLEYRGYDSAGIAVRNGGEPVRVVKAKGRLKVLADQVNDGRVLAGNAGIGHTRWATHGEPSKVNAHPHGSEDGLVTAVHNGIIENYVQIKEELQAAGYPFRSQTDTEVAVLLIHALYEQNGHDALTALRAAMQRIRGSYALAVLFGDRAEEIWVLRKDSPLVVGVEEGETFLASDVPAILKHTRSVYYIDNMEIARLEKGSATFYDREGLCVEKQPVHISWDAQAAEKGGYAHFMLKEIHEQPDAVRNTLHAVMQNGRIDLGNVGLEEEYIRNLRGICIVACGSASHVGYTAQYVLEDLAHIPVRVELASEFRYRTLLAQENTLVIVISQSGETADSLAALRQAKAHGMRTLGIVNVVGSSIAREADDVFYTLAGPEIAVATTKAYSAQLAACYALAVQLGYVRGVLGAERYDSLIGALEALPDQIEQVLREKEKICGLAQAFVGAQDVFFIGRGIDYAVCMEGSLKMKEISYIHSEAYAAGELKHGTISLIEKGTPVIGVLTQPQLAEKTESNLMECRSRGAVLTAVTVCGNEGTDAETVICIPKADPHFAASLAVVPLQLMGYYVSLQRGLDVDKPRNLAKSVTVE